MTPQLIIYGSESKTFFTLLPGQYLVGREPSCELCISDTEISRRHARISVKNRESEPHSTSCVVEDLGSLNGTFINGHPISSHQLQVGDRIQMGGTLMVFSLQNELPSGALVPEKEKSHAENSAERNSAEEPHGDEYHALPASDLAMQKSMRQVHQSIQDEDFREESYQGNYIPQYLEEAPTPSNRDSSLDVTMTTSSDSAKILRSISHKEGERFLAPRPQSDKPVLPETPWTHRAYGYLQLLYEMTLSVSHCMDIDRLSNELLELIFRWIDADRGCILLFDRISNRLTPRAKKVREEFAQQKMIISKTILDYVLERREGVLTSDATRDDRWNEAASVLSVGIHEAICVPLQGRYGIVGVIYLDTFSRPDALGISQNRFGDEHLKLMITIAHHTAIAIEDTRYYRGMLQAERLAAIGQTVATLSHHIKNILQGIQGGSYLIETGLNQHDENFVSKGWKIVERNQNRISSLILDMLTFSKDRKPEFVLDDINRVVKEIVDLMQSRAESANVVLTWNPDVNIPQTLFDPEAIHHAVLNLVTNAIDAVVEAMEDSEPSIPSSKTVRYVDEDAESIFSDGSHIFDGEDDDAELSKAGAPSGTDLPCGQVDVVSMLDERQKCVKIIVKDTGPGLTKEQISYIFKPFESSKGNRGTGLGLPVCKKIIREHGGTIHVEQRSPRGSRFVITLPIIQEQ
ncbi:MAG: ATP-binding protein [Planctomycetia bacterium]|nr:ATP-binding protein [Planctomycetia bacterium]